MALTPPTPGLRRFVNFSNDVAKFPLVVPAGHEVEVSDYVADQLPRQFRELASDEVFVHPALIVPEPPAGELPAEVPADVEDAPPAPAKRSAKKG